jgi:hypothetical protein
LYIPEPQSLPEEYRTRGASIGDVGSVTPEGAFDFLFNIYYPAAHPINANGVPDKFRPLRPIYRAQDTRRLDFHPGEYVSTPSVQEPDADSFSDAECVFPSLIWGNSEFEPAIASFPVPNSFSAARAQMARY